MIEWVTTFKAAEVIPKEVISSKGGKSFAKTIQLKGILIDTTENKNNWMVGEEDLGQVAKDFIGKQIRVDHSEKVSDVKGIITNTELDQPHKEAKEDWDPANEHPHIHYFAELTSNDDNIIIPIKMGYVTQVSPAVDAKTLLCSKCKTPMLDKFLKQCECEDGVILLKDIAPRELSIVASPAYTGTVMKPYGFGAAVDKSLGGNLTKESVLTIVEDELKKRNVKLIE